MKMMLCVMFAGLALSVVVWAEDDAKKEAPRPGEKVVSVTMSKLEVQVKVAGKGVSVTELRDSLRTARKSGEVVVCDVQMPADLAYEDLAKVLIAAAQANIRHLRLSAGAGNVLDYSMPAIDAADEGQPAPPTTRWKVRLIHQDATSWVGFFDKPLLKMSKAGAADQTDNSVIAAILRSEHHAFEGEGQLVISPAADVPCGDVIALCNDCVKAGFKQLAFAPASAGSETKPAEAMFVGEASGRARKIVYIVDCSGAAGDSFDGLKKELVRSVNRLTPVQQFDVVVLSEKSEALYPDIQRATADIKKDASTKVEGLGATGNIDGKRAPFQEAFEKAFALRPDIIYLVTASPFDPELLKVVDGLNKDHNVHVNAMAFVRDDKKMEEQLRELAKRNGGLYKFVSADEAKGKEGEAGR